MLENFDSDPLDTPSGEGGLALDQANLAQFAMVARWARYAGISLLSLMGVFILILLWAMIKSGADFFEGIESLVYYNGFWEWISTILFFAFFVMTFVIGFRLLSLGKKAQKAVDTGLPVHMEFALGELALFYKTIGILVIVYFVWALLSWLRLEIL